MRKFSLICVLVCACLILYGCLGFIKSDLPVKDKTAVVAKMLNEKYESLYNSAVYLNDNGTAKQKQFMRSRVNPTLDKAKKVLIVYNEIVYFWLSSGKVDLNNLAAVQDELTKILTDASLLIYETYQMINNGGS